MTLRMFLSATFAMASTATAAFAASDGKGGGGGLLGLLILVAIIYSFSSLGRYYAGFKAGAGGRPKSLYNRICEADGDSRPYDEGYEDGQRSRWAG